MSTGCNDRSINFIHLFPDFRSRAGSYLFDFLYRMQFIPWINSLRRITSKEILIEFQTRYFLYNWNTFVLRHSWINRRFIHDNTSFTNHFTYYFAGSVKRCQIRIIIFIYRSWNRHYIDSAIPDSFNIRCTNKTITKGRLQQFIRYFQGGIMTGH